MMLPSVLAVGIFAIVPLLGMFALSLTDFHLVKKWDQEIGLQNFIKLYNDKAVCEFRHRDVAVECIWCDFPGHAGYIDCRWLGKDYSTLAVYARCVCHPVCGAGGCSGLDLA